MSMTTINLPSELWLIIIDKTYPIRWGWNRRLFHVSRTSKAHYHAVEYLFKRYVENPVFPLWRYCHHPNGPLLSIVSLIKYLIRDFPVIEPGFVIKTGPTHLSLDPTPEEFYYKNIYSGVNFFDHIGSTQRCLVAKTSINVDGDKLQVNTIENPVIIIPNSNTNSVYAIHYHKGKWIIKIPYNFQKSRMVLTVSNKFERKSFNLRDGKALAMIRYVMEYNNPILDDFKSFIKIIRLSKAIRPCGPAIYATLRSLMR